MNALTTRLDGIDTKLDRIDTRLDKIDTRLARLEARFQNLLASFCADALHEIPRSGGAPLPNVFPATRYELMGLTANNCDILLAYYGLAVLVR